MVIKDSIDSAIVLQLETLHHVFLAACLAHQLLFGPIFRNFPPDNSSHQSKGNSTIKLLTKDSKRFREL